MRNSLKLGLSSSGCETHPANAEPGGLEVRLAAVPVTETLMCSHANAGAGGMRLRKEIIPVRLRFMPTRRRKP